jgi:2-amino-4-hydroxy-6-hydroxymethyldihydropteridine diphosphokinase
MKLQRCFIGLGSNLGEPLENLRTAVKLLRQSPGIELTGCSTYYRSTAWGRTGQPEFVNAVARIETALAPESLLAVLLEIEAAMGRKRSGDRWGPRLIDLDLLLVDDLTVSSPSLDVPHPLMHKRAFVLVPLLELAPGCVIPGEGRADQCLHGLDVREVEGIVPVTQQLDGTDNRFIN